MGTHDNRYICIWFPTCSLCIAGESTYDFSEADFVVDWARKNGMKVKGHTLVWHVTTPDFVTPENGRC